jgi:hypothetical protein
VLRNSRPPLLFRRLTGFRLLPQVLDKQAMHFVLLYYIILLFLSFSTVLSKKYELRDGICRMHSIVPSLGILTSSLCLISTTEDLEEYNALSPDHSLLGFTNSTRNAIRAFDRFRLIENTIDHFMVPLSILSPLLELSKFPVLEFIVSYHTYQPFLSFEEFVYQQCQEIESFILLTSILPIEQQIIVDFVNLKTKMVFKKNTTFSPGFSRDVWNGMERFRSLAKGIIQIPSPPNMSLNYLSGKAIFIISVGI